MYIVATLATQTFLGYHRMKIRRAHLKIFPRNGLKLDTNFIFSGLVQNVYVYRMAKSKKIRPFRFNATKF